MARLARVVAPGLRLSREHVGRWQPVAVAVLAQVLAVTFGWILGGGLGMHPVVLNLLERLLRPLGRLLDLVIRQSSIDG